MASHTSLRVELRPTANKGEIKFHYMEDETKSVMCC